MEHRGSYNGSRYGRQGSVSVAGKDLGAFPSLIWTPLPKGLADWSGLAALSLWTWLGISVGGPPFTQ